MSLAFPAQAQVVVIGGGVVGSSIAYHLTKLGCRDVVLLERSKLGSGTTWHAAGNMETYRADPLISEMIAYSVDLYPKLEQETGQALGWRRTGRVFFTKDPRRMDVFRGLPALGRVRGIEMEPLTPKEIAEKLPVISPDGLVGGLWVPSDGRINPTDLATAMGRGARNGGARLLEDTAATDFVVRNGRVCGVVTTQGVISCETAVIASGMWSQSLGALAGVNIPLHAVQHHYLLTKPLDVITRDMPMFLSYDEMFYGREDVGGLLLGFFDANAIPVSPAELPSDFSFGLFDPNWEQIEPNMAAALERFPVMHHAEIRSVINGPESFTPDMQMVLGEAPTVGGLFVAAGMNSSGIALSGAVGRLTAEWIIDGYPSLDVTKLDIRRFGESQGATSYLRDRASEIVTHMCKFPTPDLDCIGTRSIRLSPLHSVLDQRGACFVAVQSWERPIWFAVSGKTPAEAVAEEVAAAETAILVFDRSSDVVLRLEGQGADALVARLTAAAIGKGATLSPMLNELGGLECLPIIWRQGNAYVVMAEAEQTTRLKAWIARHRDDVAVADVTSGVACLHLVGPCTADLLAGLAGREIGPGEVVESTIGYAPVTMVRAAAVQGVFLLTPTEFAVGLHRTVSESGAALGLRHAGSMANDMLSTKAGVLRFGIDVTPLTPISGTALQDLLAAADDARLIGREALLSGSPLTRRVRTYRVPAADGASCINAPVLRKGASVGHVTSATERDDKGDRLIVAVLEDPMDDVDLQVLINGHACPAVPVS
ncbi:4-methylaminobutanoate oxidase (formaldehyde-forming) [Rhodoligotrophos appendicifer]|uniref:FAD-dependent oxidoreductase n=1 Tax=Rhodoligotrophos appendicifer TaxID=987056 RepID=UPI0011802BC8|nr:FAD-dependent oxidoreductase [Rhodoligotrophos appendicifer]